MIPIPPQLITFGLKYGGYILILLGGAVAVGYYGHTRYQAGLEKGNRLAAEARAERDKCIADVRFYKEKVEGVLAEFRLQVMRLKEEKAQVIERKETEYRARVKKLINDNKLLQERIKRDIPKESVVTYPPNYRVLYNRAVEGYGYPDTEGEVDPARDTPIVTGETETIDATTFSKITIGNVQQYNELATQCSTLQDIIVEIQRANQNVP